MTVRYDSAVTGPTVNGCGNPRSQNRPSRDGMGSRVCAPMAAPGGASFGWAGSLRPVFHPRSCAATPLSIGSAALAAGAAT